MPLPATPRARHPAPLALLLLACGTAAPVVDVLPPSGTSETGGPYEITVVITGASDIREAWLRWFVGADGAPRPLALVRQGESDRWIARIPGQPIGTKVRFRIEVEDDEGRLVVMPVPTAEDPTPAYEFTVGPSDSSG